MDEKYIFEPGKTSAENRRDNMSLHYGEDKKGNPTKKIRFHDGHHSGRGSSSWLIFSWVKEGDREAEWWPSHVADDPRVVSALKRAGINPENPFEDFERLYDNGHNYA